MVTEGIVSVNSGTLHGLRSVTDLWQTCGSNEGEFVERLLGKQLSRVLPGGSVMGWPERKIEFDFVREHVSGRSCVCVRARSGTPK